MAVEVVAASGPALALNMSGWTGFIGGWYKVAGPEDVGLFYGLPVAPGKPEPLPVTEGNMLVWVAGRYFEISGIKRISDDGSSVATTVTDAGPPLLPWPWIEGSPWPDAREIVAFVSARLDEDEALARAADAGPWEVGPKLGARDSMVYVRQVGTLTDYVGITHRDPVFVSQVPNKTRFRENAAHISRHDPAAVLLEVEAKRAMLRLHDRMSVLPGHPMFNDEHMTREPMVLCRSCEPETMFRRTTSWPCRTLRLLAAPYGGHPDFDPAWGMR